MSRKDYSGLLNITSPCQADWDSMFGNDRIRFCEHCRMSVHNLDLTSRKQVRKLIAKSQGRLCVRYTSPPSTPVRALYQIGRRASVIAAGAFSATLSMSGALASNLRQNGNTFPPRAIAVAQLTNPVLISGEGSLYGLIFDPNGAVITGAVVSLTQVEVELGEVRTTFSNGNGEYRFDRLKPGTYNLSIEARGFAPQALPNITLRAGDNNRLDQTLSIAPISEEVTVTSGTQDVVMGGARLVLPMEPLVAAAQSDDVAVVQDTFLTKPNANIRDSNTQSTALEWAVRNANREMIQVLLWAKANVNARDNEGQTVLMMLNEEITPEIVMDLINAGAKVNLRDNDGDSALIQAAEINNVEVLKTLLDAGAKVNGTNNEGQTALMMAASSGLVNNIRILLLAGADVNARDKEGQTALMYAKEENKAAAIRLLKSFGAIEVEETGKQ